MYSKICLLVFSLSVTFLTAQNPDSTGLSYVIDTIAAPNCFQSGDGAILLDSLRIPGTIDRYQWSNGYDREDLIFVNGGKYQLTVYNTQGEAFTTEEFLVPEPDSLVIQRFVSPPTAPTLNNGFFDLTISGGTEPFQLKIIQHNDTSIVTTDASYTLAGVDTGFYEFSVVDARGCTDTMVFDVSAVPCGLFATALIEPAECPGSSTGRIELLIENAVDPIFIDWDNGQDNQLIRNNLAGGIYGFRMRDRRMCTVSDSIEIYYEDRLAPEAFTRGSIQLYLDGDGRATLTPDTLIIRAEDGCSDQLSYSLDQSEFTCKDLGTNDLELHISDEAGNTLSKEVQVEIRDTQSIRLVYEDTVYTALCNGIAQYDQPQLQGSCSETSTGGLVKATQREITSPGIYEDQYYYVKKPGDTLKANVTIIVAEQRVRAFLIVEEPQCSNGDDGSVVVALRNSQIPVSYEWSDGSTNDFIFGLVNQKEYKVTVKEGSGCVFNLSAFIEGPDSLSVEIQEIIEKDNSIDVIPVIHGGNQPLSYAWYNQGKIISDSKNLLNVDDGKRYELVVTDARGCVSNSLIVDRVTTATPNKLQSSIDIFPNPLEGSSISIRFQDGYQDYNKIRFVNIRQKVIKEISNLSSHMNVPVHDISPGVYFIQFFRQEGVMFTKKFIRM